MNTAETDLMAPVFVGGTGRSGTSLMGNLIGSHPDFNLPLHENKLISERGGLRDIIRDLSGVPDLLRRHFAIVQFYTRAQKMQAFGFREPALNQQLKTLMTSGGKPFQAAFEEVQRGNPMAPGAIHAIGPGFGQPHYDNSINAFVRKLILHMDQNGIVDTDGLLKPFFITKQFDREELLELAREFLCALYGAKAKSRWVDDTPTNALSVDFLAELFPRMRFVHMVRNPFDTVSSYVKQVWFPSNVKLAMDQISSNLLATETLMDALPADMTLTVRLEDLTDKRGETLERLAAFLGVDNEFNAQLVQRESAHIGRSSDDPEISKAVTDDLQDWMRRHGYL